MTNLQTYQEKLERKRQLFLLKLEESFNKNHADDVAEEGETRAKGALFFGKEISLKSEFNNDRDARAIKKYGVLRFNCEKKITEYLIKNLKPTDVFYDVGANYGFYTHLALEFCAEAHAFEPLPDIFENLKNDLNDVGGARVNNLALADKNGRALLNKEKGHSGLSSLVVKTENFYEGIMVETASLDEYLKTHHQPTVIKIDVEGAEDLVIEGGKNFFMNNRPVIIMELWTEKSRKQFRQNETNATARLKDMGYRCYALDKNGEIYPYNGDFRVATESGDSWGDNYIFKKD